MPAKTLSKRPPEGLVVRAALERYRHSLAALVEARTAYQAARTAHAESKRLLRLARMAERQW
jgi:hypothetical protein